MSRFFPSLWLSPFRPFFLLGALYGPLLMVSWIPLYTGLLPGHIAQLNGLPTLWHQHEIVFGFSTAIIFGFILTALPSWADTEEVSVPGLSLLVVSWILGRLAVLSSTVLPLPLVAALDLAFPLMFLWVVGPGLLQIRYRISLGLILITAGFIAGNVCYYLGAAIEDPQLRQQGLRLGLYAMIFHCSVTVGILAPIFTENALLEKGKPENIGHIATLEWLSALSIIALAIADITGASSLINGGIALISGLLHGVRLCRWRSFQVLDTAIVWVLHAGYFWLLAALLLRAMESFGLAVGTESWVHAFTVGGFGLMSMGFMTRVTLRHTGRELCPHPAMVFAYYCLATAALVRIAVPIASLGQGFLVLSALLWVIPYVIYLALYGRMLLAPSLPETGISRVP
ncbi:MAG: NnrS family protein [Halioglobus sp.]